MPKKNRVLAGSATGIREDTAYPRKKKTRHMATVKLQPIMKPLRILLLMPTAYVRYTDIRAMEQGERKVAIPKRNSPTDSSSISWLSS